MSSAEGLPGVLRGKVLISGWHNDFKLTCAKGSRGAYRMVSCPLSIHTFDQLYLHSPQADLNHFSSIAYLWWGIDDISFSWKSSENFGCYGNHKVP